MRFYNRNLINKNLNTKKLYHNLSNKANSCKKRKHKTSNYSFRFQIFNKNFSNQKRAIYTHKKKNKNYLKNLIHMENLYREITSKQLIKLSSHMKIRYKI